MKQERSLIIIKEKGEKELTLSRLWSHGNVGIGWRLPHHGTGLTETKIGMAEWLGCRTQDQIELGSNPRQEAATSA